MPRPRKTPRGCRRQRSRLPLIRDLTVRPVPSVEGGTVLSGLPLEVDLQIRPSLQNGLPGYLDRRRQGREKTPEWLDVHPSEERMYDKLVMFGGARCYRSLKEWTKKEYFDYFTDGELDSDDEEDFMEGLEDSDFYGLPVFSCSLCGVGVDHSYNACPRLASCRRRTYRLHALR